MPPKADPYATPAQRRIDVILVLICILAVVFLFLSSSHGRAADSAADRTAQTHTGAR